MLTRLLSLLGGMHIIFKLLIFIPGVVLGSFFAFLTLVGVGIRPDEEISANEVLLKAIQVFFYLLWAFGVPGLILFLVFSLSVLLFEPASKRAPDFALQVSSVLFFLLFVSITWWITAKVLIIDMIF